MHAHIHWRNLPQPLRMSKIVREHILLCQSPDASLTILKSLSLSLSLPLKELNFQIISFSIIVFFILFLFIFEIF